MGGTRAEIGLAETEAAFAKARLQDTAARLRLRLSPRVRAREVWDNVHERGGVIADDVVEFAYEKPQLIAGVVSGVLLLLVRKPIVRLIARLFRPRRSKWDFPDTDV